MKKQLKTHTLHFTVGPSIINLPRQLYWYENNPIKAYDILDALSSGKFTTQHCKKLLEGDAYLTTKDGRTLFYHEGEDKEWKEELSKHKEFLKKKEKDETNILKVKNTDPLNALLEGNEEEATRLSNINIAKMAFIQKWSTKDPEEKKRLEEVEKHFLNKQYKFIFNGHEYTYKDSARNQGECPHCSQRAKEFIWDKDRDKESYLGQYKFNDNEVAECFECPNCHNKFFYHNTVRYS